MKPDLFGYLDYRAFLRDAFAAILAASPRLSYRNFAARSGFTSPNFLQQVIQGQRNLGPAQLLLVAKAFKLNRQEADFFRNLVGYGQARKDEEKALYYERIANDKRATAIRTVQRSQHHFFGHWYNPAVRELMTHAEFDGTPEWLAHRIFPRITVAQAAAAMETVVKLGFVRKDKASDRWVFSDAALTTDSDSFYLTMRNYHLEAIQRAREALSAFGPMERDMRSVTLGLSEAGYERLKARLEAVWKDFLEYASGQSEVDAVYQINMQMFPLTRELMGTIGFEPTTLSSQS